jgi:branched-chain amino acid transport system permease protein
MAMSVGVSVKRIYVIVFAIGSLMAGLASLLFTLDGVAYSSMGVTIVLTAFVAVFLGGVDSVGGAAISGLLLGLISSLCSLFMPSDFAPIVVFGLMYLILVFRPRGLFGKSAA